MNRHTMTTMRALGFTPRAGATDEPAARPATRPNGAADRSSHPPPGNHGWDAAAAALIAEVGMQTASTGKLS